MRIVSWNVNGIRACVKKGMLDWLENTDAEIIGLQEVRAREEQIPTELVSQERFGLSWFAAERPGYSGVALLHQEAPAAHLTSIGEERFDAEGRLQIAHFGDLWLVNGYFPNGNGKNRDLSRIPYKLDFYRALFDLLENERKGGRPILVMGDWNTCHQEIDLARPKDNRETSGFRPEEREELDRWLRLGWVDTFRHFHPTREGAYSWWSQRGNVRERNIGWRLDMILASPGAMHFLRDADIHPEILGSDHCPVSVLVDPKIKG